jgi:hypothetical protein
MYREIKATWGRRAGPVTVSSVLPTGQPVWENASGSIGVDFGHCRSSLDHRAPEPRVGTPSAKAAHKEKRYEIHGDA